MAGAGIGAAVGGISDVGQTVANAVLIQAIMKWQEKMRASAYQTMVKDLGKAGLNPALAFGGGNAHPAQTPTATVANLGGASRVESYARAGQLIQTARDQAKAVRFAGERAEADASTAWTEAENASRRTNAEVNLMDAQSVRAFEEAKLAISEGSLTSAREKHTQEQEISTRVNRMLSETELPGARARGEFDATAHGQVLREVRRFLDAVPGGGAGFFRSNAPRDVYHHRVPAGRRR